MIPKLTQIHAFTQALTLHTSHYSMCASGKGLSPIERVKVRGCTPYISMVKSVCQISFTFYKEFLSGYTLKSILFNRVSLYSLYHNTVVQLNRNLGDGMTSVTSDLNWLPTF